MSAVERRSAARLWAGLERKRAAFARVARVARRVGVAVLPVKGVLTSHLHYEEPWERPMVDVDARVRPPELARLREAGAADGWEEIERCRVYATVAFDVGGERVEVETTIGPPGYCAVTVDAMIGRARTHVEPFGVEHLQPEVHDHALVLVINAFKDRLARASEWGLGDLARMARVKGFSFERLAERAREGKVTSVAWLVARWMVERRGEAAWGALASALGERAPRQVYAWALRAVEGGERRHRVRALVEKVLVRAAADSTRMQARALVAMAGLGIELLATAPGGVVERARR